MEANVPIWLTAGLAILTGLFALGGQALSGLLSQRSQERLFSMQERAETRKQRETKREEFYGLLITVFDYTHEAVTRFRHFRQGLYDADYVITAISVAADNEGYKRLMMILDLYFPEVRESVVGWTKASSACQALLAKWRDNRELEIDEELEKEFEKAKINFKKTREGLASIVS